MWTRSCFSLNSLLAPQKARIALRRQLTMLMKMQYLLSHWDEAAASRMKPALRKGFEAKLRELSDFFGVQSEITTCASSAQLVSS